MSNSDTRRIVCGRCGANNFLGGPQCWRCHGPLPPPEEVLTQSAGHLPPSAMPQTSPRQVGPPRVWQLIALLVGAMVAATLAFFLLLHAWKAHTTPSPQEAAARLNALKDRLVRERGLAPYSGETSATDPLEAHARREIERLERQLQQTPRSGIRLPESGVGGVSP